MVRIRHTSPEFRNAEQTHRTWLGAIAHILKRQVSRYAAAISLSLRQLHLLHCRLQQTETARYSLYFYPCALAVLSVDPFPDAGVATDVQRFDETKQKRISFDWPLFSTAIPPSI